MAEINTTGKWPCPKEAENIKLGVLSNIMQEFHISAKELIDNQAKYIEMYEERTGSRW
ncbi:MAG: hypothetical protein IKB62_04245 [Oscillospiraceae bacterium]|nr:hypothetical protein [Oscillospiraceae bacterium]